MFRYWFQELLSGSVTGESTQNQSNTAAVWPSEPVQVPVKASPARSFHPVLHYDLSALALNAQVQPPAPTCHQLALYQPLPADLFVDPYQLSDVLAHGSDRVRVLGKVELENPVDEAEPTGVSIVVWKRPTQDATESSADAWVPEEVLELPIHGRYQIPWFNIHEKNITITKGAFYWLCDPDQQEQVSLPSSVDVVEDEKLKAHFQVANIYRLNNIDFRPEQADYTLDTNDAVATIILPTGRLEDASLVAIGTAVCIIVGLVWLLWATTKSIRRACTIAPKDTVDKSSSGSDHTE